MSLGHGASIVRDGLVLHLDAANVKSYPGSGTAWNDLSEIKNNGTIVGNTTYSAQNSGYFSFDGTTSYIDLNSTIQFNTSDFSISGWFKCSGTGTFRQIWMSGYNGVNSSPDVELNVRDTNYLQFFIRSAEASGVSAITNFVVNDNKWRHFTAVKTSSEIKLYIDSILSASNTGSFIYDIDTAGVLPRIGNGLANVSNRFYNGEISQISVYNKALTDQQIQTNFNALRGRYGI